MQVQKRNSCLKPIRFDEITDRINKLLYGGLNKIIDSAKITQQVVSRIHDKIKTSEIDQLTSQICMSMVTTHPAFGVLAGRLEIDNHQKITSSNFFHVIKLLRSNKDVQGSPAPLISENIENIVTKYSNELQNIIDFKRDYLLDFFSFKTLQRSYLLKVEGEIVERPQHLFLRVALGIHGDNLEKVKETYDYISQKNYTHATPTLFHAGTPRPQMSSCFLMGTEDSVVGIYKTITDCAKISKWAGGIGVHITNIRGKNSYIRKTGGSSDGIIPMLKVYNDTARYINQSGKRLGSFAMYIEPWHTDIFSFLEAKKNHGQEEERARDLFYALWIPDIFMEAVRDDNKWYLMCPDECRGLRDVYGTEFKKLYYSFVDRGKYRKEINARDLWKYIISSQIETGTPYMLFKDHCNKKSNQKNLGTISSSNLCSEIIEYSSHEEYAVCNLASICLPSILEDAPVDFLENNTIIYSKTDCEYCKLAKLILKERDIKYKEISLDDVDKKNEFYKKYNIKTVPQIKIDNKLYSYTELWNMIKPRINYKKLLNISKSLTYNLNKIIDKNFYPVPETKKSNMRHRPIGIGVQGLADLFIRLRIPFTSEKAKKINKLIFETIYFGALEKSWELSVKNGPYETFKGSPMSNGQFQFNLWGKNRDWEKKSKYDWQNLREKIMKDGIRNSLLIALMPTASTSQIMGNNECIEPYTSNIYTRRTLAGEFIVVNKHLLKDLINMNLWNERTKDLIIYDRGSVQRLTGFPKILKEIYKTVWEISQKDCIQMSADRGIFVCQSQSLNLWFEKPDFKTLYNAHMYSWKMGLKTGSYYIRSKPAVNSQRFTMDPEKEKEFECLECSG